MTKELQRPYLAQELRDAADTIWQLRDDLQRANDAVRDAEHDESRAWDRVRKAEAENTKLRELANIGEYAADECSRLARQNAKLRELVDGLTWCCEHHCRQECPLYDVSEPDHCREVSIKRELRIEVDDGTE